MKFIRVGNVMQEKVSKIISNCAHDDRALISEIALLSETCGSAVYREALRDLVGKEFDNQTARRHWEAALAHREKLLVSTRVESTLRPVLLDYLHHVVHELADPRIVEANDLDNIRTASVSDGLTGLYNQTYFKAFLDKLCGQRRDGDISCAVLLLDLDHFKQYNDRCGHLAGDKALRQVAKILLHCIRKGDVAARYGGEEFAIMLHQVTSDQAFAIADRIRKVIEKAHFQGQHLLDRQNLTVSGGLSFACDRNESAEHLIQRADEELYRAKLFRNVISPHHSENRRSPRTLRQSVVEFAPVSESNFAPAMSYDISPFGMALDCDRKLAMGEAIQLRFRHPFWPSNRQVIASVRRIDEQPESGLFRLGLKFNPEQALSQSINTIQNCV